jgi:hypothetical protein
MKRLKINHRPGPTETADKTWKPLYAALRDAVEWALDLASRIAAPYPEEQDAVERVRAFVNARLAGIPADLDVNDVMLTLGILIAAIELPALEDISMRAIGTDGGALPDAHRWPAGSPHGELPLVHHCPGALPVVTRRMPHVLYA